MSQREGEEWFRLTDSQSMCQGREGECNKTAQWEERCYRCDKSSICTMYCNECAVEEGCFSAEVEIEDESPEETRVYVSMMTPVQQKQTLALLKQAWVTLDYIDSLVIIRDRRHDDIIRQIKVLIEEIENNPE